MKRPAGATAIEVSFGGGVSIKWPSWDGDSAWDVWDSRGVRQGAVCIATVKSFQRATKLAREQAAKLDPRDRSIPVVHIDMGAAFFREVAK